MIEDTYNNKKTEFGLLKIKFLIYFITSILNFYIPIIVPFFSSSLNSQFNISILLSFYSITRIVSEFPSGILADYISRKKLLQIGLLCKIVALTFIIKYQKFFYFAVAEILLGITDSIISGTDNAFLFDEFKHYEMANTYSSFVEKIGLFQSIGLFFSFFTCSFLCKISTSITFYFTILSSIIAFISISLVCEHPYFKKKDVKYPLKQQIQTLFSIPPKRYYFLMRISLSEAIFNTVYVYLFPLLLTNLAVENKNFGICNAITTLLFGIGCWCSKWIVQKERFIKEIIPLSTILLLFFFIKCNHAINLLILIGVLRFLWGMTKTNFLCVINTGIQNSVIRATVISLYGCLINIIYSLSTLLIGKAISQVSLQNIIFILSTTFLILNALIYVGGLYFEKTKR